MKPIIAFLLMSIVLLSCKKELQPLEESIKEESLNYYALPENPETTDYLKALAEVILSTAKYSVEFKKLVYKECHAFGEEENGDYYITVKNLLDLNETYGFWDTEKAVYIQSLVDQIIELDPERPEEPMVFVPFLEDQDLEALILNCPENVPDAAIATEFNEEAGTCDGVFS